MNEMTIEATVENVTIVTEFVNEQMKELDCPLKIRYQIDVAIDELFSNIALYAYNPDTGPATVQVEIQEEPLAVIISFIDHGKPFDPLTQERPDTTLTAEQRRIGGLGVFLVRQTMDDVTYTYENGHNILTVRKELQKQHKRPDGEWTI